MLKQFFRRLPAISGTIVPPLLSNPFSPCVTLTPAFSQHRTFLLNRRFYTQVSSKPYEHLNGSEHCVPTEAHIDKKLSELLNGNDRFKLFNIKRYQGKELTHLQDSTHENEHRDWHYEQVHRLDLFDAMRTLPDMENGFMLEAGPRIHRCLLLEHSKNKMIVGAIYFTVDVKNRVAYFNLLQTENAFANNGLGKVLMHSAIYISLLYYCSKIMLVSTRNTIGFYEKMGFEKRGKDTQDHYKLDFLDLSFESEAKFLHSFASVAPLCPIDRMIEEVRMLHPLNTKFVATPQEVQEFIEERSLIAPLRP